MTDQKSFDEFYSLLKENLKSEYVDEMLREIEESEVLFLISGELETAHVLKTYTDRFIIQENVMKHDLIEGYDMTLASLRKEKEYSVVVISVTLSKASYTAFVSRSFNRLIGILKSKQHNIQRARELHRNLKSKDLSVSSKRFYKKVLQQDSE